MIAIDIRNKAESARTEVNWVINDHIYKMKTEQEDKKIGATANASVKDIWSKL